MPVIAPTITAVTTVKPPEPVPPPVAPAPAPAPEPVKPAHVPVRTGAVVDARACEKPAYPAAALRANEAGVVQLNFLIDCDGRVLEADRTQSRVHAFSTKRRGTAFSMCTFKRPTVDGKAERTWSASNTNGKIE